MRTKKDEETKERIRLANEVGQRLLQLRTGAGLSQQEFVERLGQGSQRALANYEGGQRLISVEFARRVCKAFDVNFEWLITGTGPQWRADIDQLQKDEVLHRLRRAMEQVVSEFLAKSETERSGFPDFANPRDVLAVAVRLTFKRFSVWSSFYDPAQVARFFEDLLLTSQELLGEGREMKGQGNFMEIWSKLSTDESRMRLLDMAFPRRGKLRKIDPE